MAELAADERVTLLDKLDQYVLMWGPFPGCLHITLKARSRLETSHSSCREISIFSLLYAYSVYTVR